MTQSAHQRPFEIILSIGVLSSLWEITTEARRMITPPSSESIPPFNAYRASTITLLDKEYFSMQYYWSTFFYSFCDFSVSDFAGE